MLVGLPLGGCLNFQKLLDDCDGGGGVCTAGGGDGGEGDGGEGDGGAGDGGGVSPECALNTPATLELPDGGTFLCFNGFSWVNPLPQGNELRAVWGTADDDVWVGGAASMLMHFDGRRWRGEQGEAGNLSGTVQAIVGDGAGHAWFGGTNFVFGPVFALSAGRWYSAGTLSGPVYALAVAPDGHLAILTETDIEQRASDLSLQVTAPFSGGTGYPTAWNRRGGLTFATDGRCYAAILTEDAGSFACVVQHCDGGVLASVPVDSVYRNCGAIWAEAPDALHFAADQTVKVLSLVGGGINTINTAMFPLAASFASDAGWLVGDQATAWPLPWGQSPIGVTSTLSGAMPLEAVWLSPDGGVWVVGAGGLIASATPQRPFTVRSAGINQTFYGLTVDADTVTVVGQHEVLWTLGRAPVFGVDTPTRDVWREADGGLYLATGEGLQHRTASGTVNKPSLELHGVFGFDPDDVVAVGVDGTMLTRADGGWSTASFDGGFAFWKVHGRDGRLWAVGERSTFAERLPGQPWRIVTGPSQSSESPAWYGVWMESSDAGTGWVVGGDGANRVSAGQVPTPAWSGGSLFDVWGFDGADVWAVGSQGLVLHYTQPSGQWVEVESGTRNELERVRGREYADGSRELFIVGGGGTVLRYRYQR